VSNRVRTTPMTRRFLASARNFADGPKSDIPNCASAGTFASLCFCRPADAVTPCANFRRTAGTGVNRRSLKRSVDVSVKAVGGNQLTELIAAADVGVHYGDDIAMQFRGSPLGFRLYLSAQISPLGAIEFN
jgi:hypothetical protein